MSLALLSSGISAICMALMIVTDRLLLDDFYKGRANHAWFVSSVAGAVFGLAFTVISWFVATIFGYTPSIESIFKSFVGFANGTGLLMVLVGALSIQTLLHYFRCFVEDAHTAAIAAWLAATPVFVYAGMLVLTVLFPVSEFVQTSFDPFWILGVALATFGLVLFEKTTIQGTGNIASYRRELVLMILFTVLFMIGVRQLSVIEAGNGLGENLALMPYYWFGFAAGARVMLRGGEWSSFKLNWTKRLKYYVFPVVFVEIIGMMTYWFEYLGLTGLDPVLVSIIAGTHIFIVYFLNLALGRLGGVMRREGIHKKYILGLRILERRMPRIHTNRKMLIVEMLSILIVAVGISVATYFGSL